MEGGLFGHVVHGLLFGSEISLLHFSQQTVKRADDTHEFCTLPSFSFVSIVNSFRFRSVVLLDLVRFNHLEIFHELILVLESCILCICTSYIDFDPST